MLVLLSPAKNLNFEEMPLALDKTAPRLKKDTAELIRRTKTLSRSEIGSLMKLSDDLSNLNFERYQALAKGLPDDDAQPALLAFNGDVYRGFDARNAPLETLRYAQSNVRILSGLYGLLRPMDMIHPYRLEMGTRLKTKRGKNLYDFWGEKITGLINSDLKNSGRPVINLASNEYFSSVKKKHLDAPVLEMVFREEKDEKSKVISFYAKYARGLMARWICDNKITSEEALKTFALDGYSYNEALSTKTKYVFSRPQPDPKS